MLIVVSLLERHTRSAFLTALYVPLVPRSPLVGEPLPTPSWTLVAIVGGLGVASAAIQVTMNWAQRSVAPTKATVIYAGEPVWAALLGRLAGERLTTTSLTGGALIVLPVLISDLRLRKSRGDAPRAVRP